MASTDSVTVSDATRAAFAEAGVERRFDRGEVICRQGDPAGPVMMVEVGRVEIRTDLDGDEVTVGSAGSGHLIGEVASIDGSVRTASLVAATSVTLREVDQLTFADLLESNSGVAIDVLRSVVARFRAEPTSLPSLSQDARRLGSVIIDELDRSGVPWGLVTVAQVSPTSLAASSGYEADRLTSALDELERAGLVCAQPNRIAVDNRATLERVCRPASR